nr:hypothetical protein [Tanacetum cinerariifolium]
MDMITNYLDEKKLSALDLRMGVVNPKVGSSKGSSGFDCHERIYVYAPADPDGFAPQWIGEHDPNNNNGWIEWGVPLGGELDDPMVDPEVNEEVMDDDDFDDEVEWLMAPVTPSRATISVSSTFEIGGPSTAVVERPSSPIPAPGLHVPPTVIEDLGTREIHPRVATVGEQIQVMGSQTGQIMSRLKEIETRVQQVESRANTHLSGQMAVQGQDVIAGSSQQVQTLQTALHETELQNQQLRTRVTEMESHMGILMSYMLKNHAMSEIVTPKFSFENFTLKQDLPKQNACTLTTDHPARNPFRFEYLRKDSYWSSQFKLLPFLSLSLTLKPFRVFLIDDVTLAKSGGESVNHETHVT